MKKFLRIIYNAIRFIGWSQWKELLPIETSTRLSVHKTGSFYVGKGFRTRRNVEISVRENAILIIGNEVFFNSGCIITTRESVSIGNGTIVGPYVQIFDNDHKIVEGHIQDNEYVTSPIKIGKNCWIGAGAILLKGTTLGDNCIVGAGSVIKGNYKSGTLVIQKRSEETRVDGI